ncbi:unnamed protein product [Gadus morhua 'NCC']
MFLLRNANSNDSSYQNYTNSSYSTLSSNYRLFCHRHCHTKLNQVTHQKHNNFFCYTNHHNRRIGSHPN